MTGLPFDRTADVLAQGGEVVAAGVACGPAFAAGSRVDRTGKVYDKFAHIERAALEHVTAANRKLRVDGTTYAIIDVSDAEYLPHVEVALRVVRGG